VGKILPFVIPLSEVKIAEIKVAEELLANGTAIKRAKFASEHEAFEFAIFPASAEIIGVCLTRNSEGKIVNGFVKHFTEPDGLNWFEQMEKRIS
jgi:hypothetical protein